MNQEVKYRKATRARWLEATQRSNQLFKEADKLDDKAYELLSDGVVTSDTLEKFRLAKEDAGAKYAQARKAWDEAKDEFQEKPE